jgi:hypothetical protein
MAAAATMFVAWAAMRPATANAWAWQNVCVANIYNRSGSQSAVRPYVYIPIPPNPAAVSLYLVYLAAGIPPNPPGNFNLTLRNTGWPVPTYGCYATLNLRAPGENPSCKIAAPTSGGNSFICSGDSTVTILANTNNIVANIQIPKQGGNGGPRVRARRPQRGPPAIRASQLPVDGWRGTQHLRHIGLIGRLMKTGRLPASCRGSGERRTRKVSSNLIVNPQGGRGVGAVVGSYAGRHAAHQTVSDALSRHSIGCLRRLLTSRRLHTTANSRRIRVGGGTGVRGVQVVVRRRRHGTVRRAAFMDVIGASNRRRMGVLMLPSAHREMGARVLRASVRQMLNSIGA